MKKSNIILKYSRLLVFTTLTSLILLGGCFSSSSGSGSGNGDASALIDEELALNGGEARFGGGNIPLASERESGPFSDIHFAYDSNAIDPRYNEMIRASANELIRDPSLRTEVEGHCDNRGTQEYNLALGEERAKAVARLLIQYGANPKQISTISYGEEIPLDPADNEAAYAKNRRVHFALFREKGPKR
ncbi:MAG TPA: OmpA family protein [Oligoflexia bacterium]|mgnify:CR=1 FL=1|nr:OmpA family protein [Oligoflexia bacterium]HMP49027.1 OmpA family protein [Oligoflexia bacterium]